MNIPMIEINSVISEIPPGFWMTDGGAVFQFSKEIGWKAVPWQYDSKAKDSFVTLSDRIRIKNWDLNRLMSVVSVDQYSTTYLLEQLS